MCVVLEYMIDAHLDSWFTGLPSADVAPPAVAILSAGVPSDTEAVLRHSWSDWTSGRADGTVDLPTQLRILRGVQSCPASADEFTGVLLPGEDLVFGDGLEFRVRNYGVADFEFLDAPTALAVCDDDDLSAYLRDADRAWHGGEFAGYLTHPASVVANLAGLGGTADAAGPAFRLFVDVDGVARTSPWGRGLGSYDEAIETLHGRWLRTNAASALSDAACLDEAIPDIDRGDALAERPFIARYTVVMRALRGLRATGRVARRVSGFGGRMTTGVEHSGIVDDIDAPVLAQFGAIYRAIDPSGGCQVDLDGAQVRVLEELLDSGRRAESAGADAMVQLLTVNGVARQWCTAHRAAREVPVAA